MAKKNICTALIQADVKILELSGVDTRAAVLVDGHLLGRTENQFRTFRFGLKNALLREEAELTLQFEAPVLAARRLFEQYRVGGEGGTTAGRTRRGWRCRPPAPPPRSTGSAT